MTVLVFRVDATTRGEVEWALDQGARAATALGQYAQSHERFEQATGIGATELARVAKILLDLRAGLKGSSSAFPPSR